MCQKHRKQRNTQAIGRAGNVPKRQISPKTLLAKWTTSSGCPECTQLRLRLELYHKHRPPGDEWRVVMVRDFISRPADDTDGNIYHCNPPDLELGPDNDVAVALKAHFMQIF